VGERRRRRREKLGGGVIGTRGTQPLVKRLTIGPQLELSRSVVFVLVLT